MTTESVQNIIKSLRNDEQIEFGKLIPQILSGDRVYIDLTEDEDCLWCNVMIFHLDDEVKGGRLIGIEMEKGGDVFRYDEDEIHYNVILRDGNGEVFSEDVTQLCVGELTAINEMLCKIIEDEKTCEIESGIMFENYQHLSPMEKLFLSEIIGDEEVIEHNKYRLHRVFNGKRALDGEEWEDAPFAETQKAIRAKIVKGTRYEKVNAWC